ENKASHHLDEYADSQNQLQYPCQMRGTYLHFRTAPYGIESQAIDGCIGKHIQGISDQAGRLGDQASSHFHHEHDRIDTEQHAQSAWLLRSRDCRALSGLDRLWVGNDGFLKRGA